MDLFVQFMNAVVAVRNGQPRMTGVWYLGLETSSVSKTMKSTR